MYSKQGMAPLASLTRMEELETVVLSVLGKPLSEVCNQMDHLLYSIYHLEALRLSIRCGPVLYAA